MTGFLRGSSARLAVLAIGLLLIAGVALPARTVQRRIAGAELPGAELPAPRPRRRARCPKPRVTYSAAGGETTQFGWLLAPGANGANPRDFLQYNVVGGQMICDSVALNNPSKQPVTVQLYSADAYNIAEGGAFAFTAFKDKPKGSAPGSSFRSRRSPSLPGGRRTSPSWCGCRRTRPPATRRAASSPGTPRYVEERASETRTSACAPEWVCASTPRWQVCVIPSCR